jgi:ABC-type uncharacterized transport system permease subunit
MPLLWLRIALALYGLGLLYALVALVGRRDVLMRVTIPAVGVGTIFHLISLVEQFSMRDLSVSLPVHFSESLMAFCLMAIFFAVYWIYKTSSPAIFVFPLVFLLTLSAAVGQAPPQFSTPLLKTGWLYTHIALIFAGYAALFFSFVSSLLYLMQERSLKAKQFDGVLSRLPALQVIDEIGYRALILGFPFMTFGLIAGSVIAQASFGAGYFLDPKVLLSVMMWAVYMVLLYMRWNSGWRGRRAAMLSTFAFLAALGAWVANYFSPMHRFMTP